MPQLDTSIGKRSNVSRVVLELLPGQTMSLMQAVMVHF